MDEARIKLFLTSVEHVETQYHQQKQYFIEAAHRVIELLDADGMFKHSKRRKISPNEQVHADHSEFEKENNVFASSASIKRQTKGRKPTDVAPIDSKNVDSIAAVNLIPVEDLDEKSKKKGVRKATSKALIDSTPNTVNLEGSGGKCKGEKDQNSAAKGLDNSGENLRSVGDPNGRNRNKRPKKAIAKDARDDTTQGGGLATRMTRSRARQLGNGSVTEPLIVYEDKPPARRTRRKDLLNSKQTDQANETSEPSPRILQNCSSIKEEPIVSPCIPAGSKQDLSNSKQADQANETREPSPRILQICSSIKEELIASPCIPAEDVRHLSSDSGKDLSNSKEADQAYAISEPSPRILQKCSSIKEEPIASPCIPAEDVRHLSSGSEIDLSNSKEADQAYAASEPSPRILQKCSSIKEEPIASPCIPAEDVRHLSSGSEMDLSNSEEADQAYETCEPSPMILQKCSSIKEEPLALPCIPTEDVRHLGSGSEKDLSNSKEADQTNGTREPSPRISQKCSSSKEEPMVSPCIHAEDVRHLSSGSEKVDGHGPEESIPSTSLHGDAPQAEERHCQDPEVEEQSNMATADVRVWLDLNIPACGYIEDGMQNVVNHIVNKTSFDGSPRNSKGPLSEQGLGTGGSISHLFEHYQGTEGEARKSKENGEDKVPVTLVTDIANECWQHTSGKGSDGETKSNEQNGESRANIPDQSPELKTQCEIDKQVVIYIGNQHLFSAGRRSGSIAVPLEGHHNDGSERTEKSKLEKHPISPQNIEDEGPCGVFSSVEGKLYDSIRRSYGSQVAAGEQTEEPTSDEKLSRMSDSKIPHIGNQHLLLDVVAGRRSGSIEGHHYARAEGTGKSIFGKHQISQQTIEDEGIFVEAFRFSDEGIASIDGNECSIGYCLSQENKLRMTSVSSARSMHSYDRRFSDCNSSTRRERNHLLGPPEAVSSKDLEALLPNREPVGVVCIAEEKENIPMELSYDDHTPRKMLSFSTDNTFGVSNSTIEKTCKPVTKASNLVGNMQSFLPLVIQQQAAAACPGKREVKVKALEAAEAAKRQEEKREQERRARLESLKQAKERNLQQQNKHEQRIENKPVSDVHGKPLAGSSISNSSLHLRPKRMVEVKHQAEHEKTKKLEEEHKKKEEEWKRKEMEFAAKKRKKEEIERRGREEKQEAKRRKLEDVHKLRRLQEEKQRAELEERELRRKALEESEREKRAFEEEMKRQRRLEKEREIERRRKDEQDAKDAWLAVKEAERKRKEENFQRLKLIEKEKGRAEKVSSMCELLTTAGTLQWEAQAKPNSGKDKLRAATFGHGDKRTTSLSSQAGLGPALRVLMRNHVNSPYALNASEARNSAAMPSFGAEIQTFSSISQMTGPIIAASQANGASKIVKSLGTPALHPPVRGVSSGAMGQGYCARPNVGQVEDLVTRSIIANKPCTSLGTPALHSAARGVGLGAAGQGYCASPCTEQEDVGPQTYEISPYKSSSDEEDEDDEEIPRKPIPLWARKDELLKQLLRQAHMDPDEIFASAKTCSLQEVFGTKGSKRKQDFSRRSASGDWGCDIASYKEVIHYKQSMGYLHQ